MCREPLSDTCLEVPCWTEQLIHEATGTASGADLWIVLAAACIEKDATGDLGSSFDHRFRRATAEIDTGQDVAG